MLAVHLENGRVSVRDVAKPDRPPGHALIRLLCAGICNTDLELQRGYYGFSGIPGHEFVGEVVQSEDAALQGRRVVGEINLACGACAWCARGLGRHCPNRTVLGIAGHPGCFQEYFTLPERNLHVLDDSLSNERAVFAEPVAAACEILDQVAIPADSEVAVLGDGKLGLLISQVLQSAGLTVRQFGRHAEKLALAARHGVKVESPGAAIPASAFDVVVEATGSAEGLRQAATMVRPLGTIVMKSTVHGAIGIDTAPLIVNEITLVGSRCGRFEPALDLLCRGALGVEEMICAHFPLAEAPAAFERAAARGALKVLFA